MSRDEESLGVEVPWRELEADTLHRLVEEFVTREGTDYGIEVPLDAKVREVLAQLERRTAAIVFDPRTETCTIIPRR